MATEYPTRAQADAIIAEVRARNTPNAEQLEAVKAFATKHGRTWKDKLLTAWMNGADAREPNGHLLRQVRNTLGPRWLDKVNLKKAVPVNYEFPGCTQG